MDTFFLVLMGLFALAAGFGLGAGNYHGIVGAIIPGIFAGLLAAIPVIRERQWTLAAIMIGAAVIGSVACALSSNNNGVKKFCRTQSNLYIRVGPYQLGVQADKTPSDHSDQSDK
ncbi:MAG: hypothetical protein SGJ27_09790 [Candidatus Melainabacteria bacterium]|nr:hypothetical protein [Candidatus Melainabacteria bacterium]